MNTHKITIAALFISLTGQCLANSSGDNVFYLGVGKSKSDLYSTDARTAGTLGMLKLRSADEVIFGGDISAEGTSYHNGTPESGASINFIFGRNLARTDSGRLDGALLIGGRRKSTNCPSSYLGYRCYADAEPNTSYGINYGVVVTWTQKALLLGARVTGQSNQLLLGYRY